jgi:myo-inositol-1(or 4)-monophosphatase
VKFKSPTSPVTNIDVLSEKSIIRLIHKNFPEHNVLGEESDYLRETKNTGSPYRWIIDPLDGTVNFLHGFPQCSVTIGVEVEKKIIVGGIYDPFRDELFMAERGKGATLNGKRIHVSKRDTLDRSLLLTGFPYDHREKADYYLKVAKPFLEKSMDLRRLGSAALDLAWVACGRVEGYWEFNLNPWDVAGGWLVVEEAGGKVTDFSNWPLRINDPSQILATNALIHDEMLAQFKKVLR